MKDKLRIVFMGTPEFAVGILDALVQSKHEVVGVVTVADKPAGRGQQIQQSAVKQYALSNELPILQPDKLREESFITELASLNADLFIVVAFRMLPDVVWKMPAFGTINLHASLLPKYRGAAPINWAIMNGEAETGVSTFFINENIDTGAIIAQKSISLSKDMNAGELHDQLKAIGAELTVETADQICSGAVSTIEQDPSDMNVPFAPKIFKADCEIDWSQSAELNHNRIRGLSPYPAAWCKLWSTKKSNWITFKLFDSTLVNLNEASRNDGPFSIPEGIVFPSGSGFVLLKEIQAEGKKRMDYKSFLAGNDLNELFFTAS
ncbi:MAG: methionyl-tRNA formyltransferase [Crocinitomicaceae bacterium]|nr:methionyl-tRNA formyltransferase [Crocinitomicaceae bacterium]MBP6032271.1 methionyl-tRNA formyltransferase [Crocinitomicaceae bacterium]